VNGLDAPEVLSRAAGLAGLDPKAVGPENIRRVVVRAMRRLSLDDPGRYLSLLASDPAERRLLAGEAVVQESWLFRDPKSLEGLAGLVRSLPRPVRALSVPCATGEEPASMAATLLEAGLEPGQFLVDAADANPQALAQARSGRFGPASLRGGPRPLGPCFKPDGQDMVLDPAVLARIRFIEADVLDQSFLADEPPYQAIFCRHLLIYLAPEARTRLADTLKRLLAREGVLFASPAEAVAFMDLGLTPWPLRATPGGLPGPGRTSNPEITVSPDDLDTVHDGPSPAPPWGPDSAAIRPDHPGEVDFPASLASRGGLDAAQDITSQALALADAGRLEEALALVGTILSQDGPTADLYHLKGVVLLALTREDEAEEAFGRAVYLEPEHVESLTHLELLNRARGRLEDAARLADRARRAESARSGGTGQARRDGKERR